MKYDDLNKKLDGMIESGMAKTREMHDMWVDGLDYFFSRQLKGKKKQKNWDWIVMNYIWPSAMQEIAKLAKNNPKIIARPWRDDDIEAAEVWQNATQWQWQGPLKMRLNQIAAILDGKIFGYRVSKVFWEDQVDWDDENKQWKGDVRYKLWHPMGFWASPDAETLDEAQACGTERWADLEWAKQRWPKYAKQLEEEAVEFSKATFGGGETIFGSKSASGGMGGHDTEDGTLINDNHVAQMVLGKTTRDIGQQAQTDAKVVKIEEVYFKDYATRKQKLEKDIPAEELMAAGTIYEKDGIFYDGKSNEKINMEDWPQQVVSEWDEPVFPNGRYIIRVGKTILNPSEDEQKYPYSRWPFVVIPHYLLPHMWQGINAVELYKSTQDMINVTASYMVNNMKMFGDPKVAVEDGAMSVNPKTKKPYQIKKGAGALIKLVKGGLQRMKVIDPTPIPGSTMAMYQLHAQEFKNLTGMQSISMGEQLNPGTTATEAQHLAVSSNDRIYLQSVYEDEWVKGVASLVAEIMQANYEPERWIRIVGDDSQVGVAQITSREKSVKFDIDVEPGTTLPFDEEKRIAKFEKAYAILANPAANPMLPDMLRVLEIPNWQKILQQHEMYGKFVEFTQLVEAVKAGQIPPEQAVQILIQEAQGYIEQNGGMN